MAEEKEKKGGGKKFLIFIILGVGLLLGAGAAAYFLLFSKSSPPPEEEQVPVEPDKPEVGPFLQLNPFVVNLSDPTGRRYLRVKIALELKDDKALSEANDRIPQINDTIILVLSSKTVEEVLAPEGKAELRFEIMNKLNQLLGPGKIRGVYFTQFVVQ
ncbi:flagellar basal body-associated FliL family protein [Thermosulfurimonas dismutans]|uniref:Flagellar protein FliL n=1 Tax=Thermosulfurimonas dismutans TaxID=999894 RepID=A0A179D5E8_9BACT|nr:flagellar basal body-associated FliL family protein [Thermosulfurimonas dismutans]OAQ21315.1 Flagellar biosynthesis protein FliL [Thermosulfurimonas dismutans]